MEMILKMSQPGLAEPAKF